VLRDNALSMFRWVLLAICFWGGSTGCGKKADVEPSIGSRAIRVMSINLDDHRFKDRDGDFQEDDPKPAEEVERLVSLIAASSPDVLMLREVGNRLIADEVNAALAVIQDGFPYRLVSEDGEDGRNLALFSRYPVGEDASRTNDVYRIGSHTHRMARPIMDVQIYLPGGKNMRVVHTHLRGGPVPTATDTYEMRRNEARLLTQHIRRIVREDPDALVLVGGTLHAEPDTPLLNDLLRGDAPLVKDVRPTDARGDAWTEYQAEGERHLRTDYLMVSSALEPFVRDRLIPDSDIGARGSRFRALVVMIAL
jgi:hypothetical protein